MKLLKEFLFIMVLMCGLLFCALMPSVSAQSLLPLPDSQKYGDLPSQAGGGNAQQQFNNLVVGIIQNVRYILGAVAIGLVVYAGVKMGLAQGNEDVYSTQKRNMIYAIIGLAIVGLSGEIVQIFQVSCDVVIPGKACTPGGFLKDPNAILRQSLLFNQRTQLVIIFIKYLIGSIAVLMMVISGMRLITRGNQEEVVTHSKKNFVYAFLGLALIILADNAINNVFFKIDPNRYLSTGGVTPSVDAVQGIKEIVALTNIFVSIIGPISVLALFSAGVMYMTSAGNEDRQGKAKRLIFVTIIGILVVYGAFAVVSTFIGGSFTGGVGTVNQQTGS